MSPKIVKISLKKRTEDSMIVFEWDDTRFQTVLIMPPFGPLEVYDALRVAADTILNDNGIEVL